VRASNRFLFRSAIFLASFLLFLSEPIAAKQLLPIFGGSAAVWMTCLVFFQVALLAGYLYAHAITRGEARRSQSSLHIALLLLAALSAFVWASGALPQRPAGTHPASSIFAALMLSIGLPFLILASTSPLLQVWLFRLERNAIPYRLFALSNLASLLALLSYPTLIEPHLSLSMQRALWAAGVALFALTTGAIAWQTRSIPPVSVPGSIVDEPAASAPRRSKLLWFLLPMAAAMQLSAVTAHLTSNVAAIPLLWILPLAVYLLTFILAFQLPRLFAYRNTLMGLLAVMLFGLAYLMSMPDVDLPIGLKIFFFLAEAFCACLFCHTEAYALRPDSASDTTLFYLVIAGGGAAGSFLVGIAAPRVFSGNYDLAITFLITALLALAALWDAGLMPRLLWAGGSALLVALLVTLHTAYHHQTLLATRNFYASLRVKQDVTEHGAPIRFLLNGTIQHGTQIFSPDLQRVPTTYFGEDSGAGLALRNCCIGRTKRVGIIGLGAGTLAAYGLPGDTFRFYEINPAVEPIARSLFTWLRDSQAQLSFVDGDGRASLNAEPAQHFDVLIIDAFSGDAIPLHLLTVEAMAIYRRHLVPGGILAFHVSNQFVNLQPEIAELAAASGMQSRGVSSPEDRQSGEFRAWWVLATDNAAFLAQPAIAPHALAIAPVANVHAWTDNYSSLLPLVHWQGR
jgi:hypothetical protein